MGIKQSVASSVRTFVRRLIGYDVVRARYDRRSDLPVDFDARAAAIVQKAMPFTMTTPERTFALIEAVRYVVAEEIPGPIVECGVAEGGSSLAAALTLMDLVRTDRDLFLYDTFQGMPRPTDRDIDFGGWRGRDGFEGQRTGEDSSSWIAVPEDHVRKVMARSGYPMDKIHLIKGKVEETLPSHAPDTIAILRLDTDWYESTKHELEHLYPRLAPGGVLIVDDYGHWKGSREATDEYLASLPRPRPFLARVDYSARIATKPGR